ncbi:MAG: undecaprenyl-diphosphatase UppP [bacterium]|nr:undecaprenyl-diphosphatase UppP [bacterium]
MDIVHALILAVVEGVSEFLPISSTGHLVLTSHLLGIPQTEAVKSFEIAIQLGAIASVVFLYWRRFALDRQTLVRVGIAFVPSVVIGFLLYGWIKSALLGNAVVTVTALFLGGLVLLGIDRILPRRNGEIRAMTILEAGFVGVMQSLSMIPGVSRAAATIIGGLTVGLSRKAAVEFSFLLAVPTMLAATGLDMMKSYQYFSARDVGVLAVGSIAAFVVALVTIKWLLGFVERHSFFWFGVERILVAAAFWLFFL